MYFFKIEIHNVLVIFFLLPQKAPESFFIYEIYSCPFLWLSQTNF